ncbi:MAG TPA: toxic anion resistance protein [Methylomusa anaerophila]|uniref:TelA-like protein n=1 Tax=Methylomusa anaerophila TaxID=1930071 RepID=A0A348AJB6_9FIRM|nr:toxic anion resistance protein [Methylomusa anaerophila]BBB91164.1 TelA-like protein [Methylomusa anaerophila]HML89041.1 toxic anion resistance protein [Methylomusa anaerophila]
MEELSVTPELTKDLTAEQLKRVNDIVKAIDIADSQAIINYGVSAQTKIAHTADNMIQHVRNKDAGEVGDILHQLVARVKEMNSDLAVKPGFWESLPIIGPMVSTAKKIMAKYEKVEVEIEKIVDRLEAAKQSLTRDIIMLDKMYEANEEYFTELDQFIIAGEIKLRALKDKTIPEAQAEAALKNDMMFAQKVNDLIQLAERFEKRLYDLKTSRTLSIQTAPQLRIIQSNDKVLLEKIQTSILNTIPIWKQQVVLAIAMVNQTKALQLQNEVDNATNEMLRKNSELLKNTTIETAKAAQRGIIDIDTLKTVNTNLINTIEEVISIYAQGRQQRQQAATELIKIESDLKTVLTTNRG